MDVTMTAGHTASVIQSYNVQVEVLTERLRADCGYGILSSRQGLGLATTVR
jgi:hypothetical protein